MLSIFHVVINVIVSSQNGVPSFHMNQRVFFFFFFFFFMGAQWLSDRVLDSRPKGRGFEPHRRHCVVVLEQNTFILA